MNTYKLLDQILEWDNLNRDYKEVKRNKGSAGVVSMPGSELGPHLVKNKD